MHSEIDQSFLKFLQIKDEVLAEFPPEYISDLNGIGVEKGFKTHPETPQVFILGEYIRDHLGPRIVLYYGSFLNAFPGIDLKDLRKKIRNTLAHEIMHHLERKSGLDNLGKYDREKMENFRKEFGIQSGTRESLFREFLVIITFVSLLFLMIGFLAYFFSP